MRSAVNQVQLRVRIRFRRFFRIVRLDDAVRRAVDNQHPPGVRRSLAEDIHVHDGFGIAAPQQHWPAVNLLWQILRVEVRKHHVPRARVVGNAECRVEQPVHHLRMLRGSQCGHHAALRTAHQQQRIAGIGKRLRIADDGFQILHLGQHRHVRRRAVTPPQGRNAAAAEVETVRAVTNFRQRPRVLPDGLLICHKAVADNGNRELFAIRTVVCAANGQIAAHTGERPTTDGGGRKQHRNRLTEDCFFYCSIVARK